MDTLLPLPTGLSVGLHVAATVDLLQVDSVCLHFRMIRRQNAVEPCMFCEFFRTSSANAIRCADIRSRSRWKRRCGYGLPDLADQIKAGCLYTETFQSIFAAVAKRGGVVGITTSQTAGSCGP